MTKSFILAGLSAVSLSLGGAVLAQTAGDAADERIQAATLRLFNAQRAAQSPPRQALVWDENLAAGSKLWLDQRLNSSDPGLHDPKGGEEHISIGDSAPGDKLAPSVQDTLRALINSPSHGQGIIRSNVRRVGCATATTTVAGSPETKARRVTVCRYLSTDLAGNDPDPAPAPGATVLPIPPSPADLELLRIQNKRRAELGLPALTWSEDLTADAVAALGKEIDTSRPEPAFRIAGARAPGLNGNVNHTVASLMQIMADNNDAALISPEVTSVGCATALTVAGETTNRYLRCRWK